MKSQLLSLYERSFGRKPEGITDLHADGSNRLLYRIFGPDGSSVVGVFGPDHEENRAFLSFSRSFGSIGLPVPEIYAADEEAGIYIEEDLGDRTLFAALDDARALSGDDATDGMGDREFPEEIIPLYEKVVRLLPRVQVEGGRTIDYTVAYPCAEFDRKSMAWDLNYFKYHFLKLAHIPFNEARLEADFERLCDFLLGADRSHFLYRDFQSRNIMLRNGEPWLIDYQGGRQGALQYDIASLLYDAKAALPEDLRDRLLDDYLDALKEYVEVDRESFIGQYRGFVLIRIMQAMGAYGYRGFFERKAHFLASVPYAILNIATLLDRGLPLELPELEGVFRGIFERRETICEGEVRSEKAKGTRGERREDDNGAESFALDPSIENQKSKIENRSTPDSPLAVEITSFSYRRGYPETGAANGGGFVFDCRALHNPGRYDEYKLLCGRDGEVIEFLEREEGVESFWQSVRGLVDNAVENYLERGFTDLAVSFGCTGGQHRSVYFAERLARHLADRYPQVSVTLRHREEERWGESVKVKV